MLALPVIWLATTSNTKTGNVPTGYVGTTVAECRSSCVGCPLLDGDCYAWAGLNRAGMGRHELGYLEDPGRYAIDSALTRVSKTARIARLGAMGDPAHACRDGLAHDLTALERANLVVVSYTHFWARDYAQDLADICMASCGSLEEAEQAVDMGWRPAPILPWDHYIVHGRRFWDGAGIVCPAQIRPSVTCNQCQLCCVSHPVWASGKLKAIGFLDHSRRARAELRRYDARQGLLFPMLPRADA